LRTSLSPSVPNVMSLPGGGETDVWVAEGRLRRPCRTSRIEL
jgi:hypothetical protein